MVGCLSISAGYQPFLMIFNQFGMPLKQTYFILFIFISNVVFNLLLVPFLGIFGAALGTGFAMITQVFYQRYLVKKHLQIIF